MTTPKQRMSNSHESEVASTFGGWRTPKSGADTQYDGPLRSRVHDVHTPHELVECKATAALSYSVGYALFAELYRSALLAGKRAVLHVKIQPQNVRARKLVILEEDDYLRLTRKAGER